MVSGSAIQPPRVIVSDVLALLMNRGVIATSRDNVAAIERACGITKDDIRSAGARRAAAGWFNNITLPVEWADGRTVKEKQPLRPRPKNMTKSTSPERKQRKTKKGIELWCTAASGKVGDPHFATEEEFIVKADRPWTRHSLCDAHRRMYHRARHVKVAALENISEMGIELLLDVGSNIIGMACVECGERFAKGDTICGVATMRHKVCGS